MRVAVIGTGYVGLVTGVGLASVGHTLTCFDVRESVVESLRAGKPPIYEAGLEELLAEMIRSKSIEFALPDPEFMSTADIILIAVGTPSKDGDIDLSQIEGASRLAGSAVKLSDHPISVIVKSTVVPGTTKNLVRQIVAESSGRDATSFGIGMNPEFLREGSALVDFASPDRIVLGFENQIALDALRQLYENFDCPKIEVNTETAELTKYANNMFLALQISAANEIANVAARLDGVDPLRVMEGVLSDHRWSGRGGAANAHPIAKYLIPGPGFGGSCFPKDVEALREFGGGLGLPMAMSTAILGVNAAQPVTSLAGMLDSLGDVDGQRVLVLGLSFKPDTDDIRETPSLGMVRELSTRGAEVLAHDPMAIDAFAALAGDSITYTSDWKGELASVDIVLVVTPWAEYRAVAELLRQDQILLDPRRAIDPAGLQAGVIYRSIGIR
jgi:UDPglucose 6-dehydrogenase